MPRLRHVKKARASKKVRKCGVCSHEIQPGEPYKWAKQRVGYPRYGTRFLYWCSEHRPGRYQFVQNPKVETLMRAQDDLNLRLAAEFDRDEAQSAFEDAGSQLEELADLQQESADNIREGFGHETDMVYDFEEKANNTRQVGEDMSNIDLPPEPEEEIPGEPEEPDYPGDDEDEDEVAQYEQEMDDYRTEKEEYDALVARWEEWREEIRGLADEKMGEVEV